MFSRINEVKAKHYFCLLYCLKRDIKNAKNKTKTDVFKAESKYLSIPRHGHPRAHKTLTNKKAVPFFKLVEMLFCFLQQQQGKGINKVITI